MIPVLHPKLDCFGVVLGSGIHSGISAILISTGHSELDTYRASSARALARCRGSRGCARPARLGPWRREGTVPSSPARLPVVLEGPLLCLPLLDRSCGEGARFGSHHERSEGRFSNKASFSNKANARAGTGYRSGAVCKSQDNHCADLKTIMSLSYKFPLHYKLPLCGAHRISAKSRQ